MGDPLKPETLGRRRRRGPDSSIIVGLIVLLLLLGLITRLVERAQLQGPSLFGPAPTSAPTAPK